MIFRCCQIHDRCYAEAEEVEQTWWEKVVSAAGHIIPNYNSKCENGKVTCGKGIKNAKIIGKNLLPFNYVWVIVEDSLMNSK